MTIYTVDPGAITGYMTTVLDRAEKGICISCGGNKSLRRYDGVVLACHCQVTRRFSRKRAL